MNSKYIHKTHVLQLDQSDCGVACLLSLIKFYKGNESLEKLRNLSGTTKQGTTLLGLFQAANQLGLTAEGCEANIQALIDHKQPAILHVVMENQLEHYIVCYEYQGGNRFLVGDPAKGIYTLSTEELEKIWLSKVCLTLTPSTTFVQEKVTKNSQRKWFLQLLEPDYKVLWISVLLGVFVAGLGMAMSMFSQKLIDDILPSHDTKKLISGIGLLSILLVARVGFTALREYFLMVQSKDFNIRVNTSFFSSLLQLPKPFFETRKVGELVARLNDTQRIQRVIKQLASSVVIDLLVTLISLGFLFNYSTKLGFISLVTIPVYFYIIYKSNTKIIEAQKLVMQSYSFSESNYINSMQGIATIKNNNKQDFFNQTNKELFENYQNKIFDLGKINIQLSWQSGLATVLFLLGVLSYSSYEVSNNQMKLGELMAILGIVGSLMPAIANLALVSIPLNEAKIAFTRMYEFTSLEKENYLGNSVENLDKIELKNISFRFAGRSELFANINLTLNKGKCIAIVGESGSGKSTLGQILQRFYHFENGNIIVNDKYNLQDIALEDYRNLIAVIPQEIAIFNGNVVDNIVLGDTLDQDEFMLFLKTYQLDTFFNQLPQGLGTLLGEEGINLSGGQKQVIALARALYKKPQLLLLDEATAAMDRNTEQFCIQLLQKVKNNCALFFISHRLNSLRHIADTICILENKTITFSGNHYELLQTNNFYSDYFLETNSLMSISR